MEDPKLYTSENLKDRWKVSLMTISRLARQKKLLGFKIGKNWRFPEKSVISYEKSHFNGKPQEMSWA